MKKEAACDCTSRWRGSEDPELRRFELTLGLRELRDGMSVKKLGERRAVRPADKVGAVDVRREAVEFSMWSFRLGPRDTSTSLCFTSLWCLYNLSFRSNVDVQSPISHS